MLPCASLGSAPWLGASLDQLPPFESYDIRKGHTYQYFKGQPLYTFGHGLSYATFEYSNLRVSAPTIAKDGAVTINVSIKNTSARAGDEVAQLYVEQDGSQGRRPMKALKGFQRISLKPGEKPRDPAPAEGGRGRLVGRRHAHLEAGTWAGEGIDRQFIDVDPVERDADCAVTQARETDAVVEPARPMRYGRG